MIHQPSAGFQGQASDIDIHARDVMETKQRLNGILAKHTGQTVERIKLDSDRDNFMTAESARRTVWSIPCSKSAARSP